MYATSLYPMNSTRLFSLLADPTWALDTGSVELSDAAYEYLLRFCEVNRNGLIDRIEKERTSQPTPILIHRISQLLLNRWDEERDYRFLNLLYKFKTKRYLEHFLADAGSASLRTQLNQTLSREFYQ